MTAMTTFTAPRPEGSAAIIARNIRMLMAERGVRQAQLAAVLGVAQTNVSKRLRGLTPFDTDDIDAIAEAFGIDPAELLVTTRHAIRGTGVATAPKVDAGFRNRLARRDLIQVSGIAPIRHGLCSVTSIRPERPSVTATMAS